MPKVKITKVRSHVVGPDSKDVGSELRAEVKCFIEEKEAALVKKVQAVFDDLTNMIVGLHESKQWSEEIYEERKSIKNHLERHLGTNVNNDSRHHFRAQLCAIVKVLKKDPPKKAVVLSMLREGIELCTPGYYNRIGIAYDELLQDDSIESLLYGIRLDIVKSVFYQQVSHADVHKYNLYIKVAHDIGLGININLENDPFRNSSEDQRKKVEKSLMDAFNKRYTPWVVMQRTTSHIKTILKGMGYVGFKKEGYQFEEMKKFLEKLTQILGKTADLNFYEFCIVDEEENLLALNQIRIAQEIWEEYIDYNSKEKEAFQSMLSLSNKLQLTSSVIEPEEITSNPEQKEREIKQELESKGRVDSISDCVNIFFQPISCLCKNLDDFANLLICLPPPAEWVVALINKAVEYFTPAEISSNAEIFNLMSHLNLLEWPSIKKYSPKTLKLLFLTAVELNNRALTEKFYSEQLINIEEQQIVYTCVLREGVAKGNIQSVEWLIPFIDDIHNALGFDQERTLSKKIEHRKSIEERIFQKLCDSKTELSADFWGELPINCLNKDGESLLMYAAAHSHERAVDLLLQKGANVNLVSREGVTALMRAAQRDPQEQKLDNQLLQKKDNDAFLMQSAIRGRRTAVIKRLLQEEKLNINAQDKWGRTALMRAADHRYPDIVDPLLQKEVNVNLTDKDGVTALMRAAKYGGLAVINRLLLELKLNIDAQDKWGNTALMRAVERGDPEIVYQLLRKGAKINLTGRDGVTALMRAAQRGNRAVIERLLKDPTLNINAQDEWGRTALMRAADRGDPEIVDQLLQKGAKINLIDRNDVTALMRAAEYGRLAVIERLLKDPTLNINAQDKWGHTTLMRAADRGDSEIVDQLLQKGANINLTDREGVTALMRAVECGDPEIVDQLLQKKANVNLIDRNGVTALMRAAECGHQKVVNQLLQKKANVNLSDKDGFTALMRAARANRVEIVNQLLANNAKIYKEDDNGRFACAHHHLDSKNSADQRSYLGSFLMEVSENKNGDVIIKRLLSEINDIHHFPLEKFKEPGLSAVIERLQDEGILLEAITKSGVNDSKEVIRLFSHLNLPINCQDAQGKTMLMHAVELGKIRLVDKLLEEKNINLGIQDSHGNSALILAAKKGHFEIFIKLFEKSELLFDQNLITLLLYATESGNAQIIKWILKKSERQQAHGVHDSYSIALNLAASHGHVDTVATLLNCMPSLTSITEDKKPHKEIKVVDSYQLIVNGINQPSSDAKLAKIPKYILARAILNNKDHKEKLLENIDRYLQYHLHNRTTFFGYLDPSHGQTGRRRALALKGILAKEVIDEASLREWLIHCSQSGNSEHSLRTYIHRAILPQEVIRNLTAENKPPDLSTRT